MPWIYLIAAGICEMAWPLGFKYTNGFKQNYPIIGLTVVIMLVSFSLLSEATNRGIHMGTAYAVWTGIGATGTAILGMIVFKEPRDVMRVLCLLLIIGGVVGLKILTPGKQAE